MDKVVRTNKNLTLIQLVFKIEKSFFFQKCKILLVVLYDIIIDKSTNLGTTPLCKAYHTCLRDETLLSCEFDPNKYLHTFLLVSNVLYESNK